MAAEIGVSHIGLQGHTTLDCGLKIKRYAPRVQPLLGRSMNICDTKRPI